MKFKLIVFLSALFLSNLSFSQDKSKVFLRAGVNLANISIATDGSIDDAKMLPGFQVGLLGDIPVTSFLSVQPGLLFTGKGAKTQSGQTSDASYYRATTNPMYIEVPLNIVFKLPLKDAKFFAGAGPYAAIGVAGKNKIDGKIFGVAFSSKENISFSNDDPTTSNEEGAGFGILKRFDYGLNGTVGFEGDNIMLSLNYGLGLAKLQSGSNNNADEKNKHRVLSVTIGFKL